MTEPLILWHQLRDMKICKFQVLSYECCLDFKGHRIDGISQFTSLRHCLRSSNGMLDDLQGAILDLLPNWGVHMNHIMKFDPKYTPSWSWRNQQELQPDFTSILPLPKLEKLTAPNFRLNTDGLTDESPLANALALCCFPIFLDVKISTCDDNCNFFACDAIYFSLNKWIISPIFT